MDDFDFNTSSSDDETKPETPQEDPDLEVDEAVPADTFKEDLDASHRRQRLVNAGIFLTVDTAAQDPPINDMNASAHRRGSLADRRASLVRSPRRDRRASFAVPSTEEEITEVKLRWGDETWQMKAIRFINSDGVQRFFIGLLVLDVMILFSELAIDAFVPSCKFVTRDAISCCPSDGYGSDNGYYAEADGHRFLGGGGGSDEICTYPLVETDYQAGCDYNKYHGVHVAHMALFWTTIMILGSFQIELLLLMYLIGPKIFCSQLAYVVDMVVVTMSLALELMFRLASDEALSVLPGILIVFRLWRFVRIGHGLVSSTFELQERKIHLAVEYIEESEAKLKTYERAVSTNRPKKLTRSKMHQLTHSFNTNEDTERTKDMSTERM